MSRVRPNFNPHRGVGVEGGVGVGGSVAVPGLTTKKDEAARAARGRSLLSPLFASHSPSGPIVDQLMREANHVSNWTR